MQQLNQANLKYPFLFRGLVAAWLPVLGQSGTRLRDIGPSRFHGNRLGTASPIWTATQKGISQNFTGAADGRVVVPSDTRLNSLFTTGGTISSWIFVRGWGQGGFGRIAQRSQNTTASNGWLFSVSQNDSSVYFSRIFTLGNGIWNGVGGIALGKFFHVAVAYNSSSTTNDPVFYINGAKVATNEQVLPIGTATSAAGYDIWIGCRQDLLREFDGGILDLALYNRILTPNEIRLLATKPGILAETNARILFSAPIAPPPSSDSLHLTEVGTVTRGDGFLEENPGTVNYAGRFLRTDPGYYEASAVPALASTGTMACWIRFTGSTSDYTIWSFSEAGVADNYLSLQYQEASDTLKLTMEDNGGGNETADKGSVGIVNGQWHHVALVANGDTNGYNIYLDGSDVGALSGLDTGKWLSVFADLDTTNIGVQNLATRTAGFSGDIDEVMYFDSALSASEIANLAEGDTIAQLESTYPAIHAKLTHAWNLENNYIAEDLIGSLDLDTVDAVNIASPIVKAGADRGPIFKTLDQFGSNDLTQATLAKRPAWAISRNGKTAFRFPLSTATNSLKTGTISDIDPPFTGYIVFKPRIVSGGGIRTYLYLENSGSDALGSLVLLDTGVVRWRNKFFEQLESASPVSATVPTICFFNCDTDESGALYTNGGTAVTGTVGAEPIQAICLGGRFDDTAVADGDIFEAALFSGLLNPAQMNEIGAAAATKYGGTWTDI